jgi:hypothetical protein
MLRDLAADAAGCKTVEEASGATMGTLANNAADVPFAMLYLFSEDGRESPALKKQPIEPNSPAAPPLQTHPLQVVATSQLSSPQNP